MEDQGCGMVKGKLLLLKCSGKFLTTRTATTTKFNSGEVLQIKPETHSVEDHTKTS